MNKDDIDRLVERLLSQNTVPLYKAITLARQAGIPGKAENMKFGDLKWIDGHHISGKVRDESGRVMGTFNVELHPWTNGVPKESIKESGKDITMRTLFEVFVVDPQTDEVLTADAISKSSDGAKFKALTELRELLEKDIDEYDVIVNPIGQVRDKKTVQEVKLIE